MDRLRRLDALFAEKVLGQLVATYADYVTGDKQPGFVHRTLIPGMHVTLPNYTRSLDATWEGAVRIHIKLMGIYGSVSLGTDYDAVDGFSIEIHLPGLGQSFTGSSQDHPAEALVLACLRAVGVTEDEINDCAVVGAKGD